MNVHCSVQGILSFFTFPSFCLASLCKHDKEVGVLNTVGSCSILTSMCMQIIAI